MEAASKNTNTMTTIELISNMRIAAEREASALYTDLGTLCADGARRVFLTSLPGGGGSLQTVNATNEILKRECVRIGAAVDTHPDYGMMLDANRTVARLMGCDEGSFIFGDYLSCNDERPMQPVQREMAYAFTKCHPLM